MILAKDHKDDYKPKNSEQKKPSLGINIRKLFLRLMNQPIPQDAQA